MIFDNYENEFDQDNTPIPEMDWIRDRAKKRSDKKRVAYSTGLLATALAFFGAGMLYKQNTEPLTIASQEVENNIENNKTAQQGEDPIETVPNSQVFDETICGTELPKGIVAFPKSENNEPVKTRIENQRLIATFIDGERSFEIIWPAEEIPLRANNEDFSVSRADQSEGDPLKVYRVYPSTGYTGVAYGDDEVASWVESPTEENPNNMELVDSYPWLLFEEIEPNQNEVCNMMQIDASVNGTANTSSNLSLTQIVTDRQITYEKSDDPTFENALWANRDRAYSSRSPVVRFSRVVEIPPSNKTFHCENLKVKNKLFGPQLEVFNDPAEALLAFSNKNSFSRRYIELIESDSRVLYVHSFNSEAILTDLEKTDLSNVKLGTIVEVEKNKNGWAVVRAESSGC